MAPGAVMVLFRPSEAHVYNLLRLKRLVKSVVAIDNSPTLDTSLHQQVQGAGIDVLPNFNRGGVAGAYNRGVEWLIGRGCETLFIFDQDSTAPEDYFTQMLDACRSLGSPRYLIGPKILDVNVKRYLPAHVVSRFRVKAIPITDEKQGLVPCASIITSGSVMSAETYRALGPFLEGYFIDHVDTEYGFRALCNGVPVYINTSVELKHELGQRIKRNGGFFTINQWNKDPIRQYYSARNCIHVTRRYGARLPLVSLINIITIQQIVSVALYERDKRRKIVAMWAGIIDGLRGRYGPFETCRPRAFAFCTR